MCIRDSLYASARAIGRFFEDYDVLLTPTLSQPPVPIGSLQPSEVEHFLIGLQSRLNFAWLMKAFHVINALADKIFDFMPYTPAVSYTHLDVYKRQLL